jgi:long-chain acyl-CoA synthetase
MRQTLEQANRSLANFQQIRHVLRWPEPSLPFTSTGKLLRRVVASWACEQLAATAAHPASSRGDVLLEMIASVTGESPTTDADTARLSEDLHLDSLGRVQLQSLLEQRFGLELADEQIAQVATLGELRTLAGSPANVSATAPTPEETHDQPATPREVQTPSTKPTITPAPIPTAPSTLEHRYLRWPWLSAVNILRVAFQEIVVRPLVGLLAAPSVQLPEHPATTPPSPMLIIANHITAYDVPLVLYGLPPTLRRRIAVAMSGEMLLDFRRGRGAPNALLNAPMPIAYWLLTVLFNIFPLPRLGGFRRSFEHAGRALDRGYSVLIFPEGQRSNNGTLQPFRSGIGLLAQQAETAVLPVALLGLGDVKRTGGHWFRSGRLAVRVGDPIPYNPLSTPEQTTQRLQAAMSELLAGSN